MLTFINAWPQMRPPVSAFAIISAKSNVPGPGPATTSVERIIRKYSPCNLLCFCLRAWERYFSLFLHSMMKPVYTPMAISLAMMSQSDQVSGIRAHTRTAKRTAIATKPRMNMDTAAQRFPEPLLLSSFIVGCVAQEMQTACLFLDAVG